MKILRYLKQILTNNGEAIISSNLLVFSRWDWVGVYSARGSYISKAILMTDVDIGIQTQYHNHSPEPAYISRPKDLNRLTILAV